jgi:hypothetical protein
MLLPTAGDRVRAEQLAAALDRRSEEAFEVAQTGLQAGPEDPLVLRLILSGSGSPKEGRRL